VEPDYRHLIEPDSLWVYFRVSDVFHPPFKEISDSMTPEMCFCGKILSFTDSGEKEREFAVIEVRGMTKTMIVPVSKLRNLPD